MPRGLLLPTRPGSSKSSAATRSRGGRVLGRLVRRHGQAVGEEALCAVVGDPDGDAVGPDAARVAVRVRERVLGPQLIAGEVVSEERVLHTIEHPHRLAVGPDASCVAVAPGEHDLALLDALARREVVGEEPLLAAVGDPDGLAVGPDAARRAVRLGELELAGRGPLARLEVVGVDRVAGAGGVVGKPDGGAVGPGTRGQLVAGVERLDVALHVPLEVGLARRGTGRSAAATTAAAGGEAAARDRWASPLLRIAVDRDHAASSDLPIRPR